MLIIVHGDEERVDEGGQGENTETGGRAQAWVSAACRLERLRSNRTALGGSLARGAISRGTISLQSGGSMIGRTLLQDGGEAKRARGWFLRQLIVMRLMRGEKGRWK